MGSGRGEVGLRASQEGNAAASRIISGDAGVNGCLANEAVGAVYRVRVWVVGVPAANNEPLVVEGLVSHRVWIEELDRLAIGGTPKCQLGRGEGSAFVAIQTTAVSAVPEEIVSDVKHPTIMAHFTRSLLRTKWRSVFHSHGYCRLNGHGVASTTISAPSKSTCQSTMPFYASS